LIVLMLILGRDARVVGEHRSARLSLAVVGFTIVASIAAPIAYLVIA